MAYIIENSVILSAMSEKLQDGQQNVQVIYSSQINDIEFPQNTAGKSGQDALVKITLSNGDEFTTKLLVSETMVLESTSLTQVFHAQGVFPVIVVVWRWTFGTLIVTVIIHIYMGYLD